MWIPYSKRGSGILIPLFLALPGQQPRVGSWPEAKASIFQPSFGGKGTEFLFLHHLFCPPAPFPQEHRLSEWHHLSPVTWGYWAKSLVLEGVPGLLMNPKPQSIFSSICALEHGGRHDCMLSISLWYHCGSLGDSAPGLGSSALLSLMGFGWAEAEPFLVPLPRAQASPAAPSVLVVGATSRVQ